MFLLKRVVVAIEEVDRTAAANVLRIKLRTGIHLRTYLNAKTKAEGVGGRNCSRYSLPVVCSQICRGY